MQNPSSTCPRCQSPIPADAPGGICPSCALLGVAEPTDPAQSAAAGTPTLEELAAAFPEYEILGILGQGGMGVVFKARQPRLDRLVALKILPPALAAQPGFAERFTREARALARLAHPHIVAVYDFGERAGFYYLLMEFVNGVNLRQAMRAGITPEQALGLVPRICDALQFAHDHGVLHRDIKPENILLDTAGTPKLADFGIAKMAGEEAARTGLTATGAALGTAAYMAPEQIEKPSTVDHRADIYSLGVVLYEMLTGELPLGRFASPSEKSRVAPGVDEVVLRALEKERERRQQSATEMKTQVEHLSAGGVPVTAQAPSGESRWSRVLLVLTALSAVGIPVVAMLGLSFPRSQQMVAATIVFGTLLGLSQAFSRDNFPPSPGSRAVRRAKPKDLGMAYFFWILFGMVGGHRFYLGQIGWGLLYLVTGGIFLIGWLFDLFALPSLVRRHNAEAAAVRPGAPPAATASPALWIIAAILSVPLLVLVLGAVGLVIPRIAMLQNRRPPETVRVPESRPLVDVATAERSPTVAHWSKGSIELVSIAPQPAGETAGWQMNGSPALEGPFINRGSKAGAGPGQRGYEFVFRTRDLPEGASTLSWRLPAAFGWAGGGAPVLASAPNAPIMGGEMLSVTLPVRLSRVDVRVGLAAGSWETLRENGPGNSIATTVAYGGENWAITQASTIESKDGATIVTYASPAHPNWQTRVAAVLQSGEEVATTRVSILNEQSEWRFEKLPLENVRAFRFQARPFEWVEFRDIALAPSK